MKNFHGEWQFANERLASSLVTFKNKIVQIVSVGRGFNTTANDGKINFTASLEEFNLNPFKLGFVNSKNGSCNFVQRIPTRQYRQGSRLRCMSVRGGVRGGLEHWSLLKQPAFNIYPSIDTIVEDLVNKECYEKAFSRNFSLSNTTKYPFKIRYKNRFNVGSININNAKLTLDDKHLYLTEALEESIQ